MNFAFEIIIFAILIVTSNTRPLDENSPLEGPLKLNLTLESSLQDASGDSQPIPIQDKSFRILSLFQPSPPKINQAILEQESLLSKPDTIYTNMHEFLANIFQYKPVVDTAKESEKYGNDGGKARQFGKAIISGTQGLANLVNTVIEVPVQAFRSVTKAANEKLNNLGGIISGIN